MNVTIAPGLVKYTLDRTGVNPNNLIQDEIHALPSALRRIIVPIAGPFFDTGLIIKDLATGLNLSNIQYQTSELIKIATQSTGKAISRFILILDPSVSSNVSITYQALGGSKAFNSNKLTDLVNNELNKLETISWADIQNKPAQFLPGHHLHDAKDLYGLEYLVSELNRVNTAVSIGGKAAKAAIRQLALQRAKVSDTRYAALFAQNIKSSIQSLETASGRSPGASGVTGEGTMLLHYCSGTTLMGTYYDGNIGTYDEVIEYNSLTCGYSIVIATPIINLTVSGGYVWPAAQPITTVQTSVPPIPPIDVAGLTIPAKQSVTATVIMSNLIPNQGYVVNFAKRVIGYTIYIADATVSFTADSGGNGTVNYTWTNGLFNGDTYTVNEEQRLIVGLDTLTNVDPFSSIYGVSNEVSLFTTNPIINNVLPTLLDYGYNIAVSKIAQTFPVMLNYGNSIAVSNAGPSVIPTNINFETIPNVARTAVVSTFPIKLFRQPQYSVIMLLSAGELYSLPYIQYTDALTTTNLSATYPSLTPLSGTILPNTSMLYMGPGNTGDVSCIAYTAPVTGNYTFVYTCISDNQPDSNNGILVLNGTSTVGAVSQQTVVSTTLTLNAGDVVELQTSNTDFGAGSNGFNMAVTDTTATTLIASVEFLASLGLSSGPWSYYGRTGGTYGSKYALTQYLA